MDRHVYQPVCLEWLNEWKVCNIINYIICTGYIYSITHAYPHGSHNVWHVHASTLDWLSVYTHTPQVVLRVSVDYGQTIPWSGLANNHFSHKNIVCCIYVWNWKGSSIIIIGWLNLPHSTWALVNELNFSDEIQISTQQWLVFYWSQTTHGLWKQYSITHPRNFIPFYSL